MKSEAIPLISSYKKEGLEFTVVKNNVGLEVTFVNLGGSIFSIKYDNKLMTSQVADVKDFLNPKIHNGKAVGRVAGRTRSEIVVDKAKVKLISNDGESVVHGGNEGISTKMFSQRTFSTQEHVHVVYTYFSKSGESGYPGNALFEVHYIVSNNKPKMKVKLLSYVTKTCPISITVHTFFSLGESSLKNISMKVGSKKYLEMDKDSFYTGAVKRVPACLDFSKEKPVCQDIDDPLLHKGKLDGYEHCFVFDKVDENVPQVELKGHKYGVNIFSDFDSVVVYSDKKVDGIKRDNSNEKCRRAISIEPQKDPSKSILISRGDEFSYFIRYEFFKK